ncbi:SidA/IucD/PvdA family monooxygenase [Corynebacterium sp. P5875]|uniref:L-lysine N6-monooxygenase MbtG n=1 Tax=Corynebacterium antarcticum TaxID=2800405 RepID=A0A9Q4CC00_9CORY|nr:SidA/IucD/PvdA family monooxygenase [Corynebacterium antarcticum]MCX7538098.1 SidA/IucD/PvdA family monooxygenase [Corynebacterium antarcticum]
MSTLTIVGAGPKALAVAAKAHVARHLGLDVPEMTVIDPHGVGAHWLAAGGWTDGRHRLGTSPEKDLGFPYRTELTGDHRIDTEIDRGMSALSWTSHLIDAGTYAGWIDRGRPQPMHSEWAAYLRWVSERIGLTPVPGRVTNAEVSDGGWRVRVEDTISGTPRILSSEALMLTGPGTSERRFLQHSNVLSVAGFWARVAADTRFTGRVCVVGGGETAASIIEELTTHRVAEIITIAPTACLLSRGENFQENALYTDPEIWTSLDAATRRAMLCRTDRGVLSLQSLELIGRDGRCRHVMGSVSSVTAGAVGPVVHVEQPGSSIAADTVIDARGADPSWFLGLLGGGARARLAAAAGFDPHEEVRSAAFVTGIEGSIRRDLTVDGMNPTLVLPTLAGFNQGPGFGNLSCLGLLADRILGGIAGEGDGLVSVGSRATSDRV